MGDKEEFNKLVREAHMMPIDFVEDKKRLLVVECNYLPSDYRGMSLEEVEKLLEEKYNCKVLLIDGSRINIQGVPTTGFNPVYFA